MRRTLKYGLALGLSLLALLNAGCGSSDDEDAAAEGSPVVKALYIDKGDRICQDNYAKRTKLLTRLSRELSKKNNLPSRAEQEEILVKQIMPIFWEESKELNDLPLPKEDAKEAEQILAELEQSIEDVEAHPARSLSRGTGVEFKDVERHAQKYGFEWCGRS